MRSSLIPLILVIGASAASAQTPLLTVFSESPGPAAIGPDLNGDGVADLLVGDPGGYPLPPRPGRVQAFSGTDGSLLHTWDGEAQDDRFGSAVAVVGDFNGDNIADFAFGAPGPTQDPTHRPYVQVVSARGGGLILRVEGPAWLSNYGVDLVGLDDVDGDNLPDLAVAASGAAPVGLVGEPGFVEVVSGAGGASLWRSAASSSNGLPVSLARFGDLSGDGKNDLVAGYASLERVEILSGVDGAVLRTLTPPIGAGFGYFTGFGAEVAVSGDVDGDDLRDLLVGAPYEAITKPNPLSYEAGLHHGSVYAVSSATGNQFHRTTALPTQSGFGTSIAALGDFDGNGTDDYVTGNVLWKSGCCVFQPGAVSVYSGQSGATFWQGWGGSNGRYQAAGYWNDDALADYLVSAIPPQFPETRYGTSIITGRRPQPVANFACAGTPLGCIPKVSAAGTSSVQSQVPFVVHAWGFELGSTRGYFLLGRASRFTPFSYGALCVGRPFARYPAQLTNLWGSCPESLSYSFEPGQLGQDPFGLGTTIYGQFLARAPSGGKSLSEGIAITIWP